MTVALDNALAGSPDELRVDPPSEDGLWRALVVDGDPVSRRFVELALAPVFTVEAASDAVAALDVLHAVRVDLIVCETDLGGQSGLSLARKLRQEHRLRDVPVVFLSSDRRSETRVAAFRAGVEEFLSKPCDPQELAARCEAIVLRHRRLRQGGQHRGFTLAGDFTGLSFADLLALLELGKRSGLLSIATPATSGELHFEEGQIVHATHGNLQGNEAVYAFFEQRTGQFEFATGASVPGATERTIADSVMALLMEAARRHDSAARDGAARAPAQTTRSASRREDPLAPAPKPTVKLARRYQLALRDEFSLAEPSFLSTHDLAAWSRAQVVADRMHVHLIADTAEGVAALLPLCSSPSERWVLEGLSPERKWLAINFYLRQERSLDVVLLDARDLGLALHSLRRVPAFTLYAPPEGELIAAGTRGLTALESYLRELRPPAILGLGNQSLGPSLQRLLDLGSPLTRLGVGPRFGRGASLREPLLAGLELWGAGAPEGR